MIDLGSIVIAGEHYHSKLEEINENTVSLKGKELSNKLGQTLASTLKNETGLAIRSMGPAPARPVIRGLGGDRVYISQDGNKNIDLSATSPDHAVTVEPFSVQRIEVLRGPKILIKTPTTIGGVVNVVKHEIPVENRNSIMGTAGAYGETVNKGYLGSVITEIPIGSFVGRIEATKRRSSDLKTPIGTLQNTYSRNESFSGGLSYVHSNGFIGGAASLYDLHYGIPGGFIGAHPNGVDIEISKRNYSAKSHTKFGNGFLEMLELSYNNTHYRHKEFESNNLIGSEFKIITNNGFANLHHNELGIFNNGIYGLSFEQRDFKIGGFVFTPNTKSFNISGYAYESAVINKLNFELGARLNFDSITPEEEKPDAKIGHIRKRDFFTYSLSLSMLYEISEIVYVGANLSKSSRVPTIEELFSEGPHLAAYSYEVGNPDLKSESGFGAEVFIYHNFEELNFNINVFRNDLVNYIIPRNTGEINYQTFLPIYATEGVSALFYGVDGQVTWKFSDKFTFYTSLSYTVGEFKDDK